MNKIVVQRVQLGSAKKLTQVGDGPFMEQGILPSKTPLP